MGDLAREQVHSGFEAALEALPDGVLGHVDDEAAFMAGYRAARFAVAPLVWAHALGDRFDTGQVTQLLGISRQALAKRVASGSLIGIPGRATTYYPTWQFDLLHGEVREQVRLITSAFREEADGVDPFTVAAWATTPQQELNGLTPAQWVESEKKAEPLLDVARRFAGRLAE